MAKKIRKTNPVLLELIHELKKQSNENDVGIWKDIALRLEKPSRNWAEVNLNRISKYILDKETALIPGKVLANGNLTKKFQLPLGHFQRMLRKR